MTDTLRLFIAIPLPDGVKRGLGEVQDRLRSQGAHLKWVRPEIVHLTLKFLGDVSAVRTGEIASVMREAVAGFVPVFVTARGIGVFPDFRRPRVVWAGLTGQVGELIRIQTALDQGLANLGFPREDRPFKAHLTLGRVRDRADLHRLQRAVEGAKEFTTDPFTVDRIVLFQSDLHPTGPVYSVLAEAPFSSD